MVRTAAARILGTVRHPERIVPDATSPGIVALHLKRYEFAAQWCRDTEVLDAGCGVGYGSALLGEAARVLRPGGVFVASTPRADKTTTSPDNPFHRVELSRADFESVLRRFFSEVELYGQRRLQTARHRFMQRLDVFGLRRRLPRSRQVSRLLGTPAMADVTSDEIVIERDGLDRASELLAVCRRWGSPPWSSAA